MTKPEVASRREGRVLVVTFDRTPINASSPEMISSWYRSVMAAADDPDVAVIVTANTGRAWCAGADMNLLLAHQPRPGHPAGGLDALAWELLTGERGEPSGEWRRLGLNHMAVDLIEHPKPLIASIDGAVAGGGVALALLHDVRLVSAATTFRTSFVGLGLVSELGLGFQLFRAVGPGRAMDICLSGRVVDAAEAVQIGLAERLVEGDVAHEALRYAAALSEVTPESLRGLRRLIRQDALGQWRDYLESEWPIQRAAFDTDRARAGVAATAQRLGFTVPGT